MKDALNELLDVSAFPAAKAVPPLAVFPNGEVVDGLTLLTMGKRAARAPSARRNLNQVQVTEELLDQG